MLALFLSPDNYVQDPASSQNFNRYAYCWNNPLMYTDPSGELIFTAICLLVPGLQPFLPIAICADLFSTGNLVSHAIKGDVNSIGDGLRYYSQGALAGAALGAAYMYAPLIPVVGQSIQTGMNIYGLVQGIGYGVSALSGLGNGLINGEWGRFKNANKIFLGNFYLDENNYWGGVEQGISRHTWEFFQNGLGHSIAQMRNSWGGVDEVEYLGGVTFALKWDARLGGAELSTGSFINYAVSEGKPEDFSIVGDYSLMHEFGHSRSSRYEGPLYAFTTVLPSIFTAGFGKEQIEGAPIGVGKHEGSFHETRANYFASKYFNKYYNFDWTDKTYPIKRIKRKR